MAHADVFHLRLRSRTRWTAGVALFVVGGWSLLAASTSAFAAVLGSDRFPASAASSARDARSVALTGSTAASPRPNVDAEVALAAGARWLPGLPEGCEDDFECNEGRANFPLQCCELPLVGKFCCEPGETASVPETPAWVPLPVPVNDAF
uniref:Uncharacterized protein n=1 Tax=Alexandrium andersonii TaxID=327968 RepID=A0A7S2BF97_9DINO